MERKKLSRLKWLTIRLNDDEETKLLKLYGKSASQSLSNYCRHVLLQEPVTILYRNQSADDFLTEMLQFKKELNAIGNNINQAVHKLHTLDHITDIKQWVELNESNRLLLIHKLEEIQAAMSTIYYQWLQK